MSIPVKYPEMIDHYQNDNTYHPLPLSIQPRWMVLRKYIYFHVAARIVICRAINIPFDGYIVEFKEPQCSSVPVSYTECYSYAYIIWYDVVTRLVDGCFPWASKLGVKYNWIWQRKTVHGAFSTDEFIWKVMKVNFIKFDLTKTHSLHFKHISNFREIFQL